MKDKFEFAHGEASVIQLKDISASGRARLLDMAFARLRFSLFVMPVVSVVFVWYYGKINEDYRVLIWSALYCCAALVTFLILRLYREDQKKQSSEWLLITWLPRIQLVAAFHGLGLMVLLPMVSHTATIEFKYLFTLTLAAIVAGNATHQAPMLSVFNCFLIFSWHCTVLLMPWSFSSHWQFIMPLSVLYGIGMFKHALTSHRFFVRMIWLEEEGSRLAENFKLAKNAAETALSDKNQFLTTASHDLRQPMQAMGFLIESIIRRNIDAGLKRSLDDLKQSVRLATQMFNSLLDLSRIEAGAVDIKLRPVNLNSLIDDIALIFREEAVNRNLDLRTWNRKEKVFVIADETLLRQSITNLMHNALRYTKKGKILIATRVRGSCWEVGVWDTGMGVAIDDKEHIYSPFFRNEHAWRIDSAGHGLGLAVVARSAKFMNATYGFTSSEGRGSHFWLRLPAANSIDFSPQGLAVNNLFEEIKDFSRLTGSCLIIDDDPHVCVAWESLLWSWGVRTKCAPSGALALAVIQAGFQPQVIFCDQRLRSGESGFDVLRSLLHLYPEAHGAMISGEFNSRELEHAESEGYLVLHKPLEPDQLYAILSRWLQLKQN
ncbi:ATP-binding response regulator [Cellvibrio sp. OA-2007]|uniref:ATP-binding response regulator n=1 Tax=Cellvibrio sp. OA-2007 TaxID=529823 RepID=UPI0007833AAF|nr:hybrid sensor histidine kinase/response regulator [Cellvibrio sp. OA-2007]